MWYGFIGDFKFRLLGTCFVKNILNVNMQITQKIYIQIILILLFSSGIYAQQGKKVSNDYNSILEFRVDNDFVFGTDVYFTQGLFIQVFAPFEDKNPLNSLLLPFGENAKVYHGISLVQNLYTPIEKSDSIVVTDRPFAAYLLLQSTRISLYQKERGKIISALKIGVIGPPALGEEMQNGIHSLLPTSSRISGWQNQIKTDLMINYFVKYEKGIMHSSFFDFDLSAFGNLGVPYTNIGSELNFRLGKFNNYFAALELSKQNSWQYYLSFNFNLKYTVYDATLQGGLFNKNSVHTIAADNITRFIGEVRVFGHLSFNNFKIKIGTVFITREFETGLSHKWGVLSLILGF